MPRRVFPAAAIAAATVLSCTPFREAIEEVLDRRTPRERYESGLIAAGLADRALVVDWTAAAQRALREAPLVPSTHVEEGFLPPSEPVAVAFRIALKRGQKFTFEMRLDGDSTAQLFVDAFQVPPDGTAELQQVAVADSGEREITFSPRRDAEFIVRAQPELLRGGRFTASVRVLPVLAFPVHGRGEKDIGSGFGDARDGGRRSHHGIDIFAPRGTPVVAAAPGTVHRVETTPVGGKVVWMRDTLGNRLYYAHLDSQHVSAGIVVDMGDTLGFVGNTGNARTTPPHLHFGVYSRGPVDPYWFVHSPRSSSPSYTADTSLLGDWARLSGERVALLAGPDSRTDTLTWLPRETAVRVIAATGSWFRVRLPDGVMGYVKAASTESAHHALHTAELSGAAAVLARPGFSPAAGDVLELMQPGAVVAVVGRFAEFLLVRRDGIAGWVQESAAASSELRQ
jgi:murein DD-endopeptidase MepM/ murein hydrolase activator NlpD